ncbi:hypothetical protein F4861DRAFT_542759 [Xylaria intraflava]|nr:hypothetical protein F4861DRAFT_542759 [Xylaria intraflava]
MPPRDSSNTAGEPRKRPWQYRERHVPREDWGPTLAAFGVGQSQNQAAFLSFDERPGKRRRRRREPKKKKPRARARPKSSKVVLSDSSEESEELVLDDSDLDSDVPASGSLDYQEDFVEEEPAAEEEVMADEESIAPRDRVSSDHVIVERESDTGQDQIADQGLVAEQEPIVEQDPIDQDSNVDQDAVVEQDAIVDQGPVDQDSNVDRDAIVGQGTAVDQDFVVQQDLMADRDLIVNQDPVVDHDSIADQDPVEIYQGPIAARGFVGLPAEIRDEILRYILLWPHEIVVFHNWSRVLPRYRPRLELSILYTCKILACQGRRILFGENTFMYDLRNPTPPRSRTEKVLERTYEGFMVPIDEYGHLIRRIKIKVHRSRLYSISDRQNFESSILKFLPGEGLVHPARLHTLTIEVPAEYKRDLYGPNVDNPDEIPICQYLQKGSIFNNALLKLQLKRIRVLAWGRKQSGCWETVITMPYFVRDEQMRLESAALKEGKQPDTSERAIDQSTTNDSAVATRCRPGYELDEAKTMEEIWNCKVKEDVEKLHNLAWRIEGLVVNRNCAVDERKLWKPVTADPQDHVDYVHRVSALKPARSAVP